MNRKEKRRQSKLAKKQGDGPPPSAMPEQLNKAFGLHQQGQLFEASVMYRQILESEPDNVEANHLLGVIEHENGNLAAAADLIGKAVASYPGHFTAQNNLGNVLAAMNNPAEAEQCYRRALKLKPDYAMAHNNLGNMLRDGGKTKEAERSFRRAIELQSDYGVALRNLGCLLTERGQFDEAGAYLQKALDLNPGQPEAHNDMGNLFKDSGRFDAARACYGRAIEIDSGYAEAHYNMAMASFMEGDLKQGFAGFEWRRRIPGLVEARDLPGEPWDGAELNGRRLLVFAEQGLGDTIQFARYLPLLAGKGGDVTLECQSSLVDLLSGMDDGISVIARGDELPPYDVHVPLLSLPGLLGTTLETIPADIPYLKATTGPSAGGSGLKVGLVWRGGTVHLNDHNRSASLELFVKHLTNDGIGFYSLQKERPIEETILPLNIIDLGSGFTDFTDTAAAISGLDLVISVDTAIAHLAGALGVPCWMLLALPNDWRWMLDRGDSPWYPSMRLFRQSAPGDWDGVLVKISDELEKMS